VRLLVAAQGGQVLDETFAVDVTLTARVRVEKLAAFQSLLSDLTNGKVQAEVIDQQQVLMPISA